MPTRVCRLALLTFALVVAAAPAVGAAAPTPVVPAQAQGPRSTCGVELSRGQPLTPGGPVCGTDEGDDVGFAGEDEPLAFFGENGHDTVEGSRYADTVRGGPGNDELHGGRGNDVIDGGDDSDTVFGGLGDDRIVERRFGIREQFYGGPGRDVIAGGRGTDNLYGGTGDDVLLGGTGPDVLYGGRGNDTLYGGPSRDTFNCGPGVDTVYRVRRTPPGRSSTRLADRSLAGKGCERVIDRDPTARFALRDLVGTSARDEIRGGGGRDLLQGKGGADLLIGGAGNDELEGDGATKQGGDTMIGGPGRDRLAGRRGNDRIFGDGRSPNRGPAGNDELAGGAGRDEMFGGRGADLIQGAYDGDRIEGGSGDDVVTLLGGDTSDPFGTAVVDCGPGTDTVVVNPDRRAVLRGCESVTEQFHEADDGSLLRPSPESYPRGSGLSAAAARVAADPRSPTAVRAAAAVPGRSAQASEPGAAPSPAEADGNASSPSISADGSRVAFSSDAANLVPGDTNQERTDPFLRDLGSGVTLAADAVRGGAPAIRGGRLRRGSGGGLSADGGAVAFSSNSSDIAGRLPSYSIFRRDLAEPIARRACRSGDDDSESPAISADGQWVAFESRATKLAGRDRNRQTDVYLCSVATGAVRRVSVPLRDSVDSVGNSLQPSVSGDGRFVAFTSDAGGLVRGDGERAGVYLRDMTTGQTRLVDVPPGSTTSGGSGQNPRVSADGRYVAFDSDADDLAGATGGVGVFRADTSDGTIERVAGAESTADSVSPDGSVVAFTTTGALAPGDGNGRSDVYVRTLPGGAPRLASSRSQGDAPDGPSSGGAVSADGRYVAFASRAPGALPGSEPTTRSRVFRKDLTSGALEPVVLGLDLAPRSVLAEPSGTSPVGQARLVAGTASDNSSVTGVEVAVTRTAGGGCEALDASGRLIPAACESPTFLPATLADGLAFSRAIPADLPVGSYTVRSRATDDSGQVDAERLGVNVRTFRVRSVSPPRPAASAPRTGARPPR